MKPETLTTSTVTLVDAYYGTKVTATVSYDSASKKATLKPSATLRSYWKYTVTIKGGSSGAKDLAGNPLAADKVWSFYTSG